MSVALPVLIVDLDIAARTAQWLTSGFLLTMAVVIPMSGSLLQRFPVRAIFVASMSLFCVGTLVSALAPGFTVLLARPHRAGMRHRRHGAAADDDGHEADPGRPPRADHGHHLDRHRRRARRGAHPVRFHPRLAELAVDVLDRAAHRVARASRRVGVAARRRRPGAAHPDRPRLGATVGDRVRGLGVRAVGTGRLRSGRSGRAGVGAAVAPVRWRWRCSARGSCSCSATTARSSICDRSPTAGSRCRWPWWSSGSPGCSARSSWCRSTCRTCLGKSALIAGLTSLPGGLLMGLAGPLVGRVYDRHGARRLVVPGSIMLFLSLCGFATMSAATPVWELVVAADHHDGGTVDDVHPVDDRRAQRTARPPVLPRQRHHDDPAAGRGRGGHRVVRDGDGQGVGLRWCAGHARRARCLRRRGRDRRRRRRAVVLHRHAPAARAPVRRRTSRQPRRQSFSRGGGSTATPPDACSGPASGCSAGTRSRNRIASLEPRGCACRSGLR